MNSAPQWKMLFFFESIRGLNRLGKIIRQRRMDAGALELAKCLLFNYSRTQSVVAGASGIAEWYGIGTCSAEGLFIKELYARMGFTIRLRVLTDSSAAKAVGLRQGAGRLRSLECKTLWVQQKVKDRELTLVKCAGAVCGN